MKRSTWRAAFGCGVFAMCAGFVPAGSCGKACGKAGTGADDVARVGDDVARNVPHYTPPTRTPVVIPPGGGIGDDIGGLSRSGFDDAMSTLPEVEGTASKLASDASSSGATLRGVDDPARSFGRDYARSIDELKLTKEQHGELLDAFELAQEFIEPAVDAILSATEDDDAEAERIVKRASVQLDIRLRTILSPEQRALFHAKLGTPGVVAYRIAVEQPIVPKQTR
jgi:hypothetical protein